MELKPWNDKLQHLRKIIMNQDKIIESKEIILELHSMVHTSRMSNSLIKTFEDELWEGLTESIIKKALNDKGRTIAYGLWHSARIEDITMNLLVNESEQVFNSSSWQDKINSKICDTGNQLTSDEILEFSAALNIEELINYRIAVGLKTRDIIKKLEFSDFKRKFRKEQIKRILDEKAVNDADGSIWLLDFWAKKNVAGIILMPVTRHHVVHLNESLRAKKNGLKQIKK